jgi:hypothetical protein
MSVAIQAVLALSTSPKGFTAGEVAREARRLGGLPDHAHRPCQAALALLRELRGLLKKLGSAA